MKICVLGMGFTGRLLADAARLAGHDVHTVSRAAVGGCDTVWDLSLQPPPALPGDFAAAVVTLPPQTVRPDAWDWLHGAASRRVLFGTTSSYLRTGPVVTEASPLDPEHARHDVERDFLERGGELLRLSGLYGYQRNPLYYIHAGRVGYEDRQVNFIHGDDVAAATLRLLSRPPLHAVYNLADGQRHRWTEIVDRAVAAGYLTHDRQPRPLRKADAEVTPALFLRTFAGFEFLDFWQQLPELAAELRRRTA